jgi:hypothetical protein
LSANLPQSHPIVSFPPHLRPSRPRACSRTAFRLLHHAPLVPPDSRASFLSFVFAPPRSCAPSFLRLLILAPTRSCASSFLRPLILAAPHFSHSFVLAPRFHSLSSSLSLVFAHPRSGSPSFLPSLVLAAAHSRAPLVFAPPLYRSQGSELSDCDDK